MTSDQYTITYKNTDYILYHIIDKDRIMPGQTISGKYYDCNVDFLLPNEFKFISSSDEGHEYRYDDYGPCFMWDVITLMVKNSKVIKNKVVVMS